MSLRLIALLALVVVVTLVLACGGGSELTPTPTATAPIFQRSPTPAGSPRPPVSGSPVATPVTSPVGSPAAGTPATTPSPAVTSPINVTPVAQPFQIGVDEAINVRDRPSTEGAIAGVIYPGDNAKVVGEARGQAVEPAKGDLWYQVELTQNGTTIRGFVYAPFVKRA